MSVVLTVFAFLVAVLAVVVLIYFLLLAVRGCLRLLVPAGLRGKLTPRASLISFGVTAVLFSGTVSSLVQGPIFLLLESLDVFSDAVATTLETTSLPGSDFDPRAELGLLAGQLRDTVPYLVEETRIFVASVSVPSLAIGVAFFLMLANALTHAERGASDEQRGDALLLNLRDWYVSLPPMRRSRLLLGLSVAAGAYLSFAAVISVPWLEGFDDPAPQEEGLLRVRLLDATASAKTWDSQWGPQLAFGEPLSPLEETLSNEQQMDVIDARFEKAGNAAQLDAVRAAVRDVRQRMHDLQGSWSQRRQEASTSRENALEEAIETYRRYEDKNLSERERELFRDNLTRWYGTRTRNIDIGLREFRAQAMWLAEQWRRWAVETSAYLTLPNDNWYQHPYLGEAFQMSFYVDHNPPPTPRGVMEIGFFGFFAKWLVATRSYTVALLCGMIGFGLVGSVVARALSSSQADLAVVSQRGTFDVVLVGVTASIIIFLTSQGGLAIFATGDTHPNAYILFAASLLGAAYGDRVWETAREKFFESTGQNGGGGGANGTDTEKSGPASGATAPQTSEGTDQAP